jgi:hypothetical protein
MGKCTRCGIAARNGKFEKKVAGWLKERIAGRTAAMAAFAQEGGGVRFGEKAFANEQVNETNSDRVVGGTRLLVMGLGGWGRGRVLLVRRGKLGEPALKHGGLLRSKVAEGNAHAEAGLGVDDGAGSFEGLLAAIENHVDMGGDGQGNESVHEAATPADVGGAGGHARAGGFLGDGGLGSELVAKVEAAVNLLGDAGIRRRAAEIGL